jgi:hypothetical protein
VGYFPKEWLVFFYDPPNHEWYHRFRKNGMAHCGAFAYYPKKDKWLVVEHIHRRLDLNIIDGEEVDKMLTYVVQHKGVIFRLIITPYQLYKYLKKQGCEQWDF